MRVMSESMKIWRLLLKAAHGPHDVADKPLQQHLVSDGCVLSHRVIWAAGRGPVAFVHAGAAQDREVKRLGARVGVRTKLVGQGAAQGLVGPKGLRAPAVPPECLDQAPAAGLSKGVEG